jgi:hypothetical protein
MLTGKLQLLRVYLEEFARRHGGGIGGEYWLLVLIFR